MRKDHSDRVKTNIKFFVAGTLFGASTILVVQWLYGHILKSTNVSNDNQLSTSDSTASFSADADRVIPSTVPKHTLNSALFQDMKIEMTESIELENSGYLSSTPTTPTSP